MATKDIVKHPVDSSNLEWVAYDEAEKHLYIKFLSGGVYRYFDVERDIFEKLLNADSKGRFFWAFIRRPGYKYEKVSD